jgi:hypothetical protein
LAYRIGLTFRPGDGSATFFDNSLRPIGTAVAIVLSYDTDGHEIPIRGYRARLGTDGRVRYGLNGDREFCHDGGLRPAFNAAGRAINVRRNESLADLFLRMDDACWQRRAEFESLLAIPRLPRIMLGFAPQQPPEFEVTDGLKRLAARRLDISPARLASNPPMLVERLLEQTWEGVLQPPGSPGNLTDLLLLDAEYCSQAHRALRIFEDFRQLIGAYTWNPARAVEVFRMDNPAPAALASCGIDPTADFEQAIPSEVVDQLEGLMRTAVGEHAARFSQEDLLDAVISPFKPLAAASEALSAARVKLQPYWSECTTDADLRQALRSPKDGLRASGACRIQVLRTRSVPEPFSFSAADLERRAEIDWRVHQPLPVESSAESFTQLQLCS